MCCSIKVLLLLFPLAGKVISIYGQEGVKITKSIQKPPIDSIGVKNWANVGGGSISKDGGFVLYGIRNYPPGKSTLVIQSTSVTEQKIEFVNTQSEIFVNDDHLVLFKQGRDSVCLLALNNFQAQYVENVNEYKVSKTDKQHWLAYKKNNKNDLIVRDLQTNKERVFENIKSYQFGNERFLLLEQYLEQTGEARLHIFDLQTEDLTMVWKSNTQTLVNANFNGSCNLLAFIVRGKEDKINENELWIYVTNIKQPKLLVYNQTKGMREGFMLSEVAPQFSQNGKQILFAVQRQQMIVKPKYSVALDIWSYTDTLLQSEQLAEVTRTRNSVFTSVIGVDQQQMYILESDNEKLAGISDEYALLVYELGRRGFFESHWNQGAQAAYYLVNTSTGEKKILKNGIVSWSENLQLSPSGKWILFYDLKKGNYFTHELATGIVRNITKRIQTSWTNNMEELPHSALCGFAKWLANDSAVLLRDNFDLWRVDPAGLAPPLNLTMRYGRKHNVCFDIIENDEFSKNSSTDVFVIAKNIKTKSWGFYKINLQVPGTPKMCTMGPYIYGWWNGSNNYPSALLRATNEEKYLVVRMSAHNAPNYFLTEDFKNFKQLSNVQPQRNYNWYTTELVNWKTDNNTSLQGILYKPEDFDPKKKYPIIFHYYEKKSDQLNLFLTPGASDGSINIPYFVSNGYLVFTPDIKYLPGQPGISAYRSVLSATKYLSKFVWVDSKRMGLQGHSFGGYETNFIITQTKLFAAACAAASASDLISFYGSAARGGYSIYWAEKGQGRMGRDIWRLPDEYIKNSPVFFADKVQTPLLMMNNKGDYVVPFSQGLEFFTSLRRLGKRVWMLQYDRGDHSVGGIEAEDFHKRMLQFFNHYLKDAPAPLWMTRGIAANEKGQRDGFELDIEMKTPRAGIQKPNTVKP